MLSARLRSQGKPYATLRHKHGGGGCDGGIRKLVLDRLRQSEEAILLLLFAAVVVAAVRCGSAVGNES